ncbi:MAG: hypothetical protein KatS3mg129_1799 [Leptospiraceae bacterium]|nr:MAG: hypothetical protein KatS3mg129_1799 [Leptospiraceae bacterium]
MKKQLHNKMNIFWFIIYISKIILFFLTLNCKKIKENPLFLVQNNNDIAKYDILFLQESYKKWLEQNINYNTISFYKSYIKSGIPTNQKPYFSSDGCFYFSDPFYYYNEYGLSFRYCYFEITSFYNQFNYFINHITDTYNLNLNTKRIKIQKTTINQLQDNQYILIYNSFLEDNIKNHIKQFKTQYFYYSDKMFLKTNHQIFIPKRFYENEYAILIQKEQVDFLYKINNKFIIVSIYDKNLVIDFINFFNSINIDFITIFKPSDNFFIDMLLFDFHKLKSIRISSKNNFVYFHNPKNQSYIFLFPHSSILIDTSEIDFIWDNPNLTLLLEKNYNFYISSMGIITNHWMIYDNNIIKPNEICFWELCSIKDLNYNEFISDSEYDCDINQFFLTEINPWGIFSNETFTSAGKFIEIKSNQECKNSSNKIYLKINNNLIPLPEEISQEYYLFTASNQYYYYENQIVDYSISSYKIDQSIKLIRFFPYEEFILFSGITEENNLYFIYGDKKNQILKKIHSLRIHSRDLWDFHSNYCKGLRNCEEYGMSPGFLNNSEQNFNECNISEIYIGGPYNYSGKRISTDEFIELECNKNQPYNKNKLEILYNNTKKIYYFPSPEYQARFLLLHNEPECLQPYNYIVYNDLIIPNSVSKYISNQKSISIGQYEIEHYVNNEYPSSLNFISEYNIILPTKNDQLLPTCNGYATPENNNIFKPYLYTLDYNNKNYIALFDKPYFVQIYDQNNLLLLEKYVNPNESIIFNNNLLTFHSIDERKLLRININYNYEQYDEVFYNIPVCFIDSLYIDFPETIRICFLDNKNYELYLKDNLTEIKIIPYNDKFPNAIFNIKELNSLEKNYYGIRQNECLILIEPIEEINQFILNPVKSPFVDKYLTTSNKNKIGNGLSNKEYLEIYTYINGQKISLCSFGIPEIKQNPFYIPNQSLIRHNYYYKNNTNFSGLNNFNKE